MQSFDGLDLFHCVLLVSLGVTLVLLVLRAQRKTPEEVSVQPIVEVAPALVVDTPIAEHSALQLLGLLQQKGRLIDFVQEDITAARDEDLGVVARVVHQGCREVLRELVELESIHSAEEESRVVVEAGFDPQAIRLTGNVVGQAPYRGVLLHKGWRVKTSRFPKANASHRFEILMPAEIEL